MIINQDSHPSRMKALKMLNRRHCLKEQVSIYFDGGAIRDKKANGPYKVHISLCDKNPQFLDEGEFYTINNHKYSKFSKW